jgi:hypothetical protein
MKHANLSTLPLTQVGKAIDREFGAKMVKDFQDQFPQDVKSYFIGREIIEEILRQPNCAGIRFYNALNEYGDKTLVYVGIDEDENIIAQISEVSPMGKLTTKQGIVADRVRTGGNGESDDPASWEW